jgi:hypothetical protein
MGNRRCPTAGRSSSLVANLHSLALLVLSRVLTGRARCNNPDEGQQHSVMCSVRCVELSPNVLLIH